MPKPSLPVAIDINAIGMGRIVLGGVDLSDVVAGFDLRVSVGELARLTLDVNAIDGAAVRARLDAEGVDVVVRDHGEPPAQTLDAGR